MPRIIVQKYRPDYGSHMPVLIKIFEISEGPVLELGMGVFSTPLLHMLCLSKNRSLTSYEGNQYYVERHSDFVNDLHQISLVSNWDDIKTEDTKWGVVFIDHSPEKRRSIEARRIAKIAQFVILHDSDPENDRYYGYNKIYPLFKYRFDYTSIKPSTTVLSNFVDVTNLKI